MQHSARYTHTHTREESRRETDSDFPNPSKSNTILSGSYTHTRCGITSVSRARWQCDGIFPYPSLGTSSCWSKKWEAAKKSSTENAHSVPRFRLLWCGMKAAQRGPQHSLQPCAACQPGGLRRQSTNECVAFLSNFPINTFARYASQLSLAKAGKMFVLHAWVWRWFVAERKLRKIHPRMRRENVGSCR